MKIKLNKRAYIFLVGIVAIIVIIALVSGGKKDEESNEPGTETKMEGDTRVITGEKLSEPKDFNGLEFTNVKFKIFDNTTWITAEVKNTSTKITEEQYVDFNVLDKQGNKILVIGGHVAELQPGETTLVSTSRLSEQNDAKAYNVEVVPQQPAEQQLADAPSENGENNNENNENVKNNQENT